MSDNSNTLKYIFEANRNLHLARRYSTEKKRKIFTRLSIRRDRL